LVSVTMKELLEAGVHFGHQTKRWNPKMKEFIFGQRNGIYIIDLQKTIKVFKEAIAFIQEVAESGRDVLMVGTKKQAQDIIKDYATQCEACFVNQRWLGGLLTNFDVIRGSVDRLVELEEMKEDGRWDLLSKKEQSKLEKVFRKLSKNLGGIKTLQHLPGVLVVIDSTKEDIAISEAQKLGIPIVAVVDTNGDPENIDYPIPGNDDAVRAIELFTAKISEAILEGKKNRMEKELLEQQEAEEAVGEAVTAEGVVDEVSGPEMPPEEAPIPVPVAEPRVEETKDEAVDDDAEAVDQEPVPVEPAEEAKPEESEIEEPKPAEDEPEVIPAEAVETEEAQPEPAAPQTEAAPESKAAPTGAAPVEDEPAEEAEGETKDTSEQEQDADQETTKEG